MNIKSSQTLVEDAKKHIETLSSDEVKLELSLPNRAGILMPTKSESEAEQITMLVMPVMLNS